MPDMWHGTEISSLMRRKGHGFVNSNVYRIKIHQVWVGATFNITFEIEFELWVSECSFKDIFDFLSSSFVFE